jgi:uncharacterized Zn-binding protein involved in type VI secretion
MGAQQNAARMGDKVKHNNPHCHAPIHPPAPTPTPQPHSCSQGHPLMMNCAPTVMINSMQAATVTSQTIPCIEVPCVPGGPGLVAMGAFTVLIGNLPAARKNDMTAHSSCVAPIPAPVGKIDDSCSSDVKIG